MKLFGRRPPWTPLVPEVPTQRLTNKWLNLEFTEVLHNGRVLRFASSELSSRKRILSLFSKEPITLAWIDSFAPGETLYDVGANIGIYTIYAAIIRGATVYAFEPESLNFAELNKNIFLNALHGRVIPYGIALSDADRTDRLLLCDFAPAISHHDFEENSWKGDKTFGETWSVAREGRLEQGCIGRRLDSLIADGLPVPHHIKIDVDGLEHRVAAGMLETLRHPALKTVLIEINFDDERNLAVVETMVKLGWRYSWDQLRTHRSVRLSEEKIRDLQERGQGGLNYVFFRDPSYEAYFARIFETYTPGEPIETADLLPLHRG